MDDLMKLIAVEGLYQFTAKQALRSGTLLSREDFARMQHHVVFSVDQMLDAIYYGIIPVPVASDVQPLDGNQRRLLLPN